jgi:hypothetical protein
MERKLARIGERVALSRGRTAVAERKRIARPGRPKGVVGHELAHAFGDPANVLFITIIPGPGYAGATYFKGAVSPRAAAAPHAYGYDGTSYDLHLIERSGYKVSDAVSAARGVLEGKEFEMAAAGHALAAAGTLSGEAFRYIIANARKGPELVLRIIGADGAEESRRTVKAANDEFVEIPFELPKAA